MENEKCVMVIDDALPLGLVANMAAIMGITMGREKPEAVGRNVKDQSGAEHLGIIEFPVPILKGSAQSIRSIREKLCQAEYADVIVVDFSDLAQRCKTYREYEEKMANVPEAGLTYLGVALCGPKRKINRLTGCMPLLR